MKENTIKIEKINISIHLEDEMNKAPRVVTIRHEGEIIMLIEFDDTGIVSHHLYGKNKIYNPFGENASCFLHKEKWVEKGTRKFKKIMKQWRKQSKKEEK